MSVWIESHQTLRDHPRKDELAELLFSGTVPDDVADYAAIGLLHELWWWAMDYAQDGDLSVFTDRQLAKACRWTGDPQMLVEAFQRTGFLTSERLIHDWDDYAGKLIRRREQDRRRKSEERSAGRPLDTAQDVRKTSDASRARGPNPTQPNRTQPNQGHSSPDESGQTPKVTAPKVDEHAARAAELLEAFPFPSDLLQLAEIMAGENKTGTVSLRRVVRELYEPLAELAGTVPEDAMRYGLRAAITAQAPNANYVKRAVESFKRNGSGTGQRSGRAVDSAFGAIGEAYRELESQ